MGYTTRAQTAQPPVAAPSGAPAIKSAVLSKTSADARFEAMEQAIGAVMKSERLAWLRRVNELERRITELEARK